MLIKIQGMKKKELKINNNKNNKNTSQEAIPPQVMGQKIHYKIITLYLLVNIDFIKNHKNS